MNNNEAVSANFIEEYSTLIKNAQSLIETREYGSELNSILKEVKVDQIQIAKKNKIALPFLIQEMKFLNTIYSKKENDQSNFGRKWLKALEVILESLRKYIKHPFLDIAIEIVRISNIFTKGSSKKRKSKKSHLSR